ncbi:MAG: HDIG domain-containing protein [Bacteroidia bacterium]
MPLLTHVGALYHDVGKMVNHRFFIENMSEGQNPHDQLSCEESTAIIIGHVKRGIELAHKYSLPREIIEFIETHHGTTRVEYFYRIFLRENSCDAPEFEEKFRYPGPKPFSKETAALMIADSIEAASRSMKNPTPEKLKELVDSVIDYKIKDNQLENSNLTFNDIAVIRRVIHKQLLSIYHSRIQYPANAVGAEKSV